MLKDFLYNLINKIHISFNLMVRFINRMIKTNLCMIQDLSHLYTIELTGKQSVNTKIKGEITVIRIRYSLIFIIYFYTVVK